MLLHSFAFFALYLSGFWTLRVLAYRLPQFVHYLLAFHLGIAIWVVSALTLLLIGVPFTAFSMATLFAALNVALYLKSKSQSERSLLDKQCIFPMATVFIIIMFASYFSLTVLSFDSHIFIIGGHVLAEYKSLYSSSVATGIAEWNIGMMLIQALAPMVGYDFIFAIFPLNLFIIFAALVYFAKSLCPVEPNSRLSTLVPAAVLLIFGTTYLHIPMIGYLSPNMIFAAYLFILVVSLCSTLLTGEKQWLIVAGICLVAIQTLRIEAPLITLLILSMYLPSLQLSRWSNVALVFPCSIFSSVWFFWLVAFDNHLGTRAVLYAAMAGAMLAFAVFTVLNQKFPFGIIWQHLEQLVFILIAVAFIGAEFYKPDHMAISINQFFGNLIAHGRWGAYWWVAIPFCFIFLSRSQSRLELRLLRTILAFVLLILFLACFREPYRTGWSDSANRMMNHIAPVLALLMAISLRSRLAHTPDIKISKSYA